jgi:hypothetical protein
VDARAKLPGAARLSEPPLPANSVDYLHITEGMNLCQRSALAGVQHDHITRRGRRMLAVLPRPALARFKSCLSN